MKKLLLLLLIAITTNSNAADKQFICTFTSSIKVTKLSNISPKAETQKIDTRFTFLLSPDGSASYINLKFGIKLPVTAIVENHQTVFLERANSDNLFMVTIFNKPNANQTYPAIYSFAAWMEVEHYYPHMDFGTCSKI